MNENASIRVRLPHRLFKGHPFFFLALVLLATATGFSQDSSSRTSPIAFKNLFHNLEENSLGSFKYDYGMNFLAAGLVSYGVVESGLDWKWYQMSLDNRWIGNTGFVAVGAGSLVPMTLPLGLYLFGRIHGNTDMQMTGLALGQAALLGLGISSGIKVFTGRVPPDNLGNKKDYSGDFRFGFWRGGAFEGWPSSHTTIAFAMAGAITELYPGNTLLNVGAFTYASLIGIGVSTNIHWLSDAVAGAFIGYAIGKAVGLGFTDLKHQGKGDAFNFVMTPEKTEVVYKF